MGESAHCFFPHCFSYYLKIFFFVPIFLLIDLCFPFSIQEIFKGIGKEMDVEIIRGIDRVNAKRDAIIYCDDFWEIFIFF